MLNSVRTFTFFSFVRSTLALSILVSANLIPTLAQAEPKIKIGISVPLTGDAAAYGTDIKNALVFANQRLFNSQYELVIEDDQCSDREAVSVAHKLVSVDKVNYMLGFGCSGTVLASAPVYNKAKVLVIASGTGAPAITLAGDYIFRTKPSLLIAANLLAKEMSKKYKKVGIISEETAYCQGLADATAKSVEKLKVEIMRQDFHSSSDDFRTMLLKLKAHGVEAIFLNPQGEPGFINMFKQLRSLGWKAPIYGTFLPGTPSFINEFGNKSDGIIYADLQFNDQMLNKQGIKLFADFEKEYGKVKSAEHYAALSIVAFSALNKAIHSGQDAKNFLYKNTFDELVDGFSFDENGDVVSDKLTYALKTLKSGAATLYRFDNH